jgi:pimeloyl-ACP methyl ester carboxylesterase
MPGMARLLLVVLISTGTASAAALGEIDYGPHERLAAAAGAPVAPQLRACTIDGEPARCGSITVPENHRDPQGRQLTLDVLVLGGATTERREPIFILAGGPGQGATSLRGWAATAFENIRRTRDVVLIDQRGSGGSHRLDCAVAPGTFVVPDNAEQCVAGLSRSATLSLYGTETFIDDLELARKALRYGRIVVYGASYGTRAAYAYARRYPQNVRAVILTAPVPVSMPVLDTFAENGRRSLDAIVVDCLADRACSRAFPQLKGSVERFRATTTDPFRVVGLQFLQYSNATAVHIPKIVSAAARGNLAPLDSTIAAFREQLMQQIALGLNLTIACSEDLPFGDTTQASIARLQYVRACRNWPKAAVSPAFHEPVRLDVPALVVVGEWDPATSPRWARLAAEQFSPHHVVTLPRAGHVLDGFDACMGAMIAGFLDRGTADSSCATSVRRPPYVLR